MAHLKDTDKLAFNVTDVEAQAQAELSKERAEKAKARIKASLHNIANAEAVLENLKRQHEDLLAAIRDGN